MKTKQTVVCGLLVVLFALAFIACDSGGGGGGGGGGLGGEQPGGQQPGGQQPGGQKPGGQQPGCEQPGGQQPGGEQPGGDPELSGSIEITNDDGTLTATYTGDEGDEDITYQWEKDGEPIPGATGNTYTPPDGEEGSYTVTVSKPGYKPKTSDPYNPSLSDLSGHISIADNNGTLTATYTGNEPGVTYQWNKDGEPISGATGSTYTPTGNGSYTVTVSKPGYNPKTSAAVTVNNIGGNAGMTWTAVADNSTFGVVFPGNSEIGSGSVDAITWGNGKFVAGGSYGRMAYSPDGVTWTAVNTQNIFSSSTSSDNARAIAWGNNKFVAVGSRVESGNIYMLSMTAYSTDGITWTAVTNNTFDDGNAISGIAYGGGKFVAVGSGGLMAYSSDGSTWSTVANSTFSTTQISTVAWGNNKFVAVGYSGKMAYSSDGSTWSTVTNSTFSTSNIRGIAWGNNRFVAVGYGGKMAYSSDGIAWTAVTDSTFGTSNIEDIAWGNNRFVAVGYVGKMAYSADGVTWTAVTDSTFGSSTSATSYIYSIGYGNGRFVAGGWGGRMAYSSN